MSPLTIAEIRVAIMRHHRGHETTTDAGIRRLWDSLDSDTQARYLEEPVPAPPEDTAHVNSVRPE